MMEIPAAAFARLVTIMDELREKCPWDRKQTIQSLRQLSVEELYELADAIDREDWKGIKEELGDLMLHILFYAKIGAEQGQFTLEQVLTGIADKLVTRHPHIYAPDTINGELTPVNSDEDVKRNWEKLKLKEGKRSVLSGVPIALPAMVKAMRLQEKARQVGFEWENKTQVWDKVEEEIAELKAAIESGDKQHTAEEFGDLVFSLVNYARFLQVDAEHALEQTNKKFIHRFIRMEEVAALQKKMLADMTLAEMDDIWNSIKKEKPGL